VQVRGGGEGGWITQARSSSHAPDLFVLSVFHTHTQCHTHTHTNPHSQAANAAWAAEQEEELWYDSFTGYPGLDHLTIDPGACVGVGVG
jgi:hypothetical protein